MAVRLLRASSQIVVTEEICPGCPAHEVAGHRIFVLDVDVSGDGVVFLPKLSGPAVDCADRIEVLSRNPRCISAISISIQTTDSQYIEACPRVRPVPLVDGVALPVLTGGDAMGAFKTVKILNERRGLLRGRDAG